MVTLLANRLGLNSRNSSKPPSTDTHRSTKKNKRPRAKNKPGGQVGRKGSHLEACDGSGLKLCFVVSSHAHDLPNQRVLPTVWQ